MRIFIILMIVGAGVTYAFSSHFFANQDENTKQNQGQAYAYGHDQKNTSQQGHYNQQNNHSNHPDKNPASSCHSHCAP